MKKTLLSLVLFSSLMTLSGCLKGCDKDKKHSEPAKEHSMDKKEEGKTEEGKAEKNAEMENLKKADLEHKDEIKDKAINLYKSASMDRRPDEIWFEARDEELGYGEPRISDASRYRYGERNSRFV
jgi:hypothetical protein